VPAGAYRGRNASRSDTSSAATESIRLNKYIARAGVCSRRKADELIEQGRVKVNGNTVTELGSRVAAADEVEVNGRSISPRRHVYLLVNKPKNTITTTDDPHDRETVMELIALPEKEKGGLFPVGRLDRETTGVLVITNDGDLAHRLMHPGYEVEKLYRVRTKNPVKPHELDLLRKGILLDDGKAAVDEVVYVAPPDRRDVGLSIHEGRNRQIRRMFEALGHEVVALERVNYAGLTAEGVRPGKWRRLTDHEVRQLRRQVKLN
jgi:23S rRNA pseudouridine2605 synthase